MRKKCRKGHMNVRKSWRKGYGEAELEEELAEGLEAGVKKGGKVKRKGWEEVLEK